MRAAAAEREPISARTHTPHTFSYWNSFSACVSVGAFALYVSGILYKVTSGPFPVWHTFDDNLVALLSECVCAANRNAIGFSPPCVSLNIPHELRTLSARCMNSKFPQYNRWSEVRRSSRRAWIVPPIILRDDDPKPLAQWSFSWRNRFTCLLLLTL